MKLKLSDIPSEIKREYKIQELASSDKYVYCQIRKGMYGLPQAGIIAQELLAQRLAKYGYNQSKIVPGLWTHNTKPVCFTLCVDDFAIKFTNIADATHLIEALKKDYTITIDWDATKYIGLTIKGDYDGGKVHMHMPGYIEKTLKRFNHEKPSKKQNSPYPHKLVRYGAKIQYADDHNESPPLGEDEKKYIQALTGTLLYYGRAVDSTILPALIALALEQNKPTQNTMATTNQLLDYCASQDEAVITYKASKMILNVHSDAGYLNEKRHEAEREVIFSCRISVNPPPGQQWRHSHQPINNKSGGGIGSFISQHKRGNLFKANIA